MKFFFFFDIMNLGVIMDKLNCIENYFAGTRAYYLFQLGNFFNNDEYKEFILEKENLTAAKVAFVSNIMLGIKEELVDNKGNLVYQSKIFLSWIRQGES